MKKCGQPFTARPAPSTPSVAPRVYVLVFFYVHGKKVDVSLKRTRTIMEWKILPRHCVDSTCHSIHKKLRKCPQHQGNHISAQLSSMHECSGNTKSFKGKQSYLFGNDEWPGSLPDLNACEHLGTIFKDRVEQCIQNHGKTSC